MPIRSTFLAVALGLLALAGSGCSPQAKKARHLAQADRHFTAGEYDKAEIEYKNVLQIEPQNPPALGRLGIIYFEQSRVLYARSFLMKASQLSPDNLELKLKLGLTDLAFQDSASARTRALFVLDRAPQDEAAPLLLVEAASNPTELEAARQRLLQLPPATINSAPVQVALGAIELRLNKIDAAEAAFQRALVLNPKWPDGHSSMAVIHILRKNMPLALQEIKLAAELSPARSPKRIQYAQALIQNNESAAGRAMLVKMTKEIPDYLPAWMLLAQLSSGDNKYDEALILTGRVLARDGMFPEALLLNGRLRMAKGDFAKAVSEFENSLKTFPTSPQFSYQLGLAYVASGETKKAIEILNQTLALAPGYTDATVLLASLNLKTGDPTAAISALKTLVQQHPELIQPRLLLADAYRARNNLDEALAVYEQIEKNFPSNPRTPLLKGGILLQQGKQPEARQAFTQALEREPNLEPAVEQLVNLDLMDKQYPAARQRIDSFLAKQPKSAAGYQLLARIHAAQKEFGPAEAALQKAIEAQPEAPTAYFMLAALHLANNRQQPALESLKQVLAVNPKDTRALLMTAILNQQLKSYDTALAAYEKLLTVDPKSGIALNNVAVLYAERYDQLDKAYEAAKKARELYPRDPNLADTFGWILIQKRQYPLALSLLEESAEKMPGSLEIQYHLGVAHYLMGDEPLARVALENALKANENFKGIEDARKRLAVLKLDASQAEPGVRKAVEAVLAERPDDPVALVRLAAIHERERNPDKAIDSYQAALKASPANVPVMLNLIRLYTAQNDPAKALEVAKAARKLAPDNAAAGLALGQLAYQSRDYPWAFSLLQETARKMPDDADVLRALAKSAYSVGQVAAAETALQSALKLDAVSSGANEARSFLALIRLADNPAQAAAASAQITQSLKSTPADVPTLMVAATISEQKPDASAAIATYQKVLEQFPDFTPAMKRLAILHAANPGDNKKAFDLALKARAAFPADAELAQAFGIILYRQGDFTRALAMLKESSTQRSANADLAYYLGMTQYRLNDRVAAKQSLLRSLDLKLKADLATEARKILADLK